MGVFVDASPLIRLARIDRLDLSTVAPSPIFVATAVWMEVTGDSTRPGIAALHRAQAAGILSVVADGDPAEFPFLGRGEAQTLSAARSARAAVIADDAEARRFLRSAPTLVATIPSTLTTVELVVLAKRRGLIAERLYLHQRVYEQALRSAGEWPPAWVRASMRAVPRRASSTVV